MHSARDNKGRSHLDGGDYRDLRHLWPSPESPEALTARKQTLQTKLTIQFSPRMHGAADCARARASPLPLIDPPRACSVRRMR